MRVFMKAVNPRKTIAAAAVSGPRAPAMNGI
jgi:hypothetical protein